jgi:hypothetical protein
MHGQKCGSDNLNIPELERRLETRNLQPIHRQIGEFSQIQRRVGGGLKRMLLRLNNLCYRLNLARDSSGESCFSKNPASPAPAK